MDSLPLEIIANQIFKYFDFSAWLKSLVFVAKFWLQAAIKSTVSKQIAISAESGLRSLKILSRYNIDTIIVKNMGSDLRLLARIINASNKLYTAAFVDEITKINGIKFSTVEEQDKNSVARIESSFPQISTLAIRSGNLSFLRLFPNVSRLKLSGEISMHDFVSFNHKSYPSVKELEVALLPSGFLQAEPGFGLGIFKTIFPNLQTMYLYARTFHLEQDVLPTGFKIVTNFPHDGRVPFSLSATSYHEFTYSHGETPLVFLARSGETAKVSQLLESQATTREYEADLRQRSPCFVFPPLVAEWKLKTTSSLPTDGNMDIILIRLLQKHNIIDYWETFELLANNSYFVEVIEHLKTCKDNLPIPSNCSFAAVKAVFTFNTAETIAAIGDKEAAKAIMNVKNTVNSFTLAHQMTDRDLHMLDYLDYFDVTIENNDKHNPATVAFNSKNYATFCKFRQLGAPLQLPKFKGIPWQQFFTTFAIEGKAGYEAVKYLQNKGESSVFVDKDWARMLQAIFNSRTPDSMALIKYLFEESGESFYSENAKGHALIESVILQNEDKLTTYMASKIDINHVDSAGFTPLLYAIKHRRAVPILLELGADINVSSGKKSLPIIYACKHTKLCVEDRIVQELIDYGADINTVDYDSRGRKITPLGAAIYKGKLTKELNFLLAYGADPNFVDDAGNTLHHTLLAGTGSAEDYVEVAKYLTGLGLDVNQKNNLDEAPLHLAILTDYSEIIAKTLVELGADVNQQGPLKMSPLMMAVGGYLPVLEILLSSKDIDLKAHDVYGRSVVQRLCHEITPKYLKSAMKRKEALKPCGNSLTEVFRRESYRDFAAARNGGKYQIYR